jgi:tetratricopeptide (TPR) repeat protein
MTVHSKTKRRVLILVAATLGLGGLAAGAVVWRKAQIAERVEADRVAGFAALENKDYSTALHKIGPFLQRNPTNAEALFKYGEARRNVEEPNSRHIVDAIAIYRRLLELNPDYPDAREQLFELYLQAGFNTEILAAAEGRTDLPSVRARAIAQGNLGRTRESVATLETYLAAKPDDLRTQFFAIGQMQLAGRSTEDLLKYSSDLSARFPNDRQYDLLTAYVHTVTGDRARAIEFARRATQEPLKQPEQVEIATDLLDALGEHGRALAVLTQAGEAGLGAKFKARVIARLYQSQKHAEVFQRLADLNATDPKADITLLAHKAMAATELGKTDEAGAIIQALAARKDDSSAVAWAKVLAAIPADGATADDRVIIEACRDGLRLQADNPYFRFHLGDAYDRLGESELAMTEWSKAAEGARIWPVPLGRLVQTVMLAGRGDILKTLLPRLEELSGGDPRTLAIIAAGQARLADRDSNESIKAVLPYVDRVLAARPGDPIALQLKLAIIAKTQSADAARAWVDGLTGGTPPLPTTAYLALARAAEGEQLGTEEAIYKQAAISRPPIPELATAHASWLVRGGRQGEALATFDSLRAAASTSGGAGAAGGADVQWQLGHALILDLLADPGAAKAWTDLVDAAPDNAAVQRAGLSSKALADQPDVQRRVIDRLGKIIGDEGVAWRLADARLILQEAIKKPNAADRERDIVKATAMLSELTRRYPDQLTARLMLAACFLQLDKRDEAIPQLAAAVRLAPGAIGPVLETASLLQAKGDFDQAKPYLEQAESILLGASAGQSPADSATALLPGSPLTRVDALRTLSSLLAARGESARAVEILRQIPGSAPDQTDPALAEMLATRGELTDDMLRQLEKETSLRSIELVAEHYARLGRMSDALAALGRIDTVEAKPGEREVLRGMFARRRLDFAKAIPELQAAVKADPTLQIAWQSLIECLVMVGRGTEAVAASREAASALPASAQSAITRFKAFAEDAELVVSNSNIARLRPLVTSLLGSDSGRSAIAEALAITSAANQSNKSVGEVITLLRPLSERPQAPRSLQYLMVDLYESAGNLDEAVTLANRLAGLYPTDPTPLGRAAEMLANAGRWQEAIPVAQQWKQRLGRFTFPADSVLGASFVGSGQFAQALAVLEPYNAAIAADPAGLAQLLSLRARAMVGTGRTADAEALLFPLLSQNAVFRDIAMQIAVISLDAKSATRWIETVMAAVPQITPAEQLRIAGAWMALGGRVGTPALAARSDVLIQQASKQLEAAQPDATLSAAAIAGLWTDIGAMHDERRDQTAAIAAYRRAIAAHATASIAQNNLAAILMQNEAGLPEAFALASSAVADSKHPAYPDFLDTLGMVQLRQKRFEDAAASLQKAISLAPARPSFRVHYVEALASADKKPQAREALAALQQLADSIRSKDATLEADLRRLAELVK